MKGAALKTQGTTEDTVDTLRLLQFCKNKVPELAEEIGQKQDPVIGFPHTDRGAGSFDIGIAEHTLILL